MSGRRSGTLESGLLDVPDHGLGRAWDVPGTCLGDVPDHGLGRSKPWSGTSGELETQENSWKQLFRGVRRPFFRVFPLTWSGFGLPGPEAQIWAQTVETAVSTVWEPGNSDFPEVDLELQIAQFRAFPGGRKVTLFEDLESDEK